MLFNSYVFWAFFAGVLLLYRLLNHRWQNRMLLVASYVFYGSWDWRFLSLILFTTLVNFFTAIAIEKSSTQRAKKFYLAVSAVVCLGLLGVFKYYGFFSAQLTAVLTALGIPSFLPTVKIVLPVGISFFTFQTMSYTIDVYRGEMSATRRVLDFALYVAFFPQLVAGPIERSSRLLPQIIQPRQHKDGDFAEGLFHVLMGLFKKIIIADNMAPIVNAIFSKDPSALSGVEVLVGVYAFAFQIYGDFSGYSSVARGVAKWLGFDLMTNFRMPYLAKSPSDFWKRWHISLSSWLRDYLYIPLGGNRNGNWKTYRNLILTMLLGGLWHGAGWTFIAWGAFHGIILVIYRLAARDVSKARERASRLAHAARVFVMFNLACLGWLLFRAQSMTQAVEMLGRIFYDFRLTNFAEFAAAMLVFFVGPFIIFDIWLEKKGDLLALTRSHWLARGVWYSYIVLMMWFFPPGETFAFIYFQF